MLTLTQNHKLVSPFFPSTGHVLLVERPAPPSRDEAALFKEMARRHSDERLHQLLVRSFGGARE